MDLDKILSGMYEDSCQLHAENRDSELFYSLEKSTVQSLCTLGLAYCNYLKDYKKAYDCLKAALKIDKSNWLIWTNLCHICSLQDKNEEAYEAAIQAIKFSEGQSFDAFYNAGVISTMLGQIEESIQMYKSALNLIPEHSQANYNLALGLLRNASFEEGWKKYEYRFKTSELTGKFKDRFIQDHWDGRKFKKKSLLVYSEQGLGDFIFFSRFLPIVKSLGGKVVCELQKPLADIVGKNLKVDEIILRENNTDWPKAPISDYCVSISSLPRILKINNLDQIPTDPYIFAPNKPRPEEFSKDKFNIGICWSGNPDHQRDFTRSFSLEKFKPLSANPKIQLFGLVKGVSGLRNWPQGWVDLNFGIENFPMIDLKDKIEGFSDLAHYVNHLDLVITIDSGLAHLAGAMGKDVWTLLGKETDWRWMNDSISTWYPSMKLFRCKDTWENLIKDLVSQLPS